MNNLEQLDRTGSSRASNTDAFIALSRKTLCALSAAFLLANASFAQGSAAVQVRSDQLGAFRNAVGSANISYAQDYSSFTVLRVDAAALSAASLRAQAIGFEVLEANRIRFGTVDIDPVAQALAPASGAQGLKLVQFQSQAKQAWLDTLKQGGMEVLQAYPGNAYLVWAPAGATTVLRSLPVVRWTGDFQAEFKIDGSLRSRQKDRETLIENVVAHVYASQLPQTLGELKARGADVISFAPAQPDKKIYDIVFKAIGARIEGFTDIAQLINLNFSGPRPILEDEMSSQIVAGNTTGTTVTGPGYLAALNNFGLSGAGVIWAVTDSGVDLSQPEFAGNKIAGGYTYPGCPAGTGLGDDNSAGGHGTHVAGIIAGAGLLNVLDANGYNYGIGVAPGAKIFAQNPICVNSVPWPPAGGWQELSKRALAGGASGTNNSWTSGEGTNAGYTNGARTHDLMVRDGDFDTATVNEAFMVVFSAGNSGPGANTLTSPKESKNPIIVAASRNQRVGSVEDIAGFSSRGPSVDGRNLPTITTPGEQIASTRRVAGAAQCGTAIAGTSNNYAFCSGTSMAAPHASGFAALLIEWYRNRNAGATPSPALVKALMVNGAVDMAGPASIPNTTEGWGRINLPNTVDSNKAMIDQTQVLTDVGATFTRTWTAVNNTKPVRLTLTWTDAAAAISANPTLVNDLDLEVTAGGNTYLGNAFTSGASSTGGTADRRNNVENVYLPAGTGTISFTVRAQALSGDGVPNLGDATDQDFAIVCSNCIEAATFTMSASSMEASLCAGSTLTRTINIGNILGFSTPVSMSSSGMPAPGSVSFSINPIPTPGQGDVSINTTGLANGNYSVLLTGTAGSEVRSLTMPLFVAISSASPPTLSAPANAASNVIVQPTLSWAAQANAYDYLVELSTSANFATIAQSFVTRGTSVSPATLSFSTSYFWRVTARNACVAPAGADFRDGFEDPIGSSAISLVSSFTTVAAPPQPGDCPAGTTVTTVLNENMESGAPGFTHAAATGADSWAISNQFAASPTQSYRGVAPGTAADQRLLSPPIAIPSGTGSRLLAFKQRIAIEPRSAGGCFDAGIIEVSTDAGATFTQVINGITGVPYTGAIQTGNVLNGANGWCGASTVFQTTAVDLAPYLGQTVQFRFRLTSDGSVSSAEGWSIDDVIVRSCSL